MDAILNVDNTPIGTTVYVDGKVVHNVFEVDVLKGVARFYKSGPDNKLLIGPNKDLVRAEKKGRITIEYPEPIDA